MSTHGTAIRSDTARAAQTHSTAHTENGTSRDQSSDTKHPEREATDDTASPSTATLAETAPATIAPATIAPVTQPQAADAAKADAKNAGAAKNARKQNTAQADAGAVDAIADEPLEVESDVAAEPIEAALTGESLQETARRLKLALPLAQGRIVVLKSRRRLELWNGATFIKTYRVALGATPAGHKRRQGDGRTPEGEFRICTRNATSSAFHIFLGLSYPEVPDAARGLKDKTISQREYQAIRSRLASRSAPLWSTRLGGWVGIHGGNGGAFARKRARQRGGEDWTAGCVALSDKQIEELYAATRLGTRVSIRP